MTKTVDRFVEFHSGAESGLELGAEALLYVMAHGHTISVPTQALLFAEKVGVISIARRDTPVPVLADVNRALDLIAASLRTRERLDREAKDGSPTCGPASADNPAGGLRSKLEPPTPRTPPNDGAAVAVPRVADVRTESMPF
jgi:hypothetical protein